LEVQDKVVKQQKPVRYAKNNLTGCCKMPKAARACLHGDKGNRGCTRISAAFVGFFWGTRKDAWRNLTPLWAKRDATLDAI
jgi:hypothetical protein